MGFDFDQVIDRRVTESLKWGRCDANELPMWVADMDFRAPEPVIRALAERVAHGIFGYGLCPDALRETIVERLQRLYGWQVTPEAILFFPGVVPAFNLAIQAFVPPDAGVLVQTPVYPPILHAAEKAGVLPRFMELTRMGDGHYEVDLDCFDALAADRTRMFLLCNPHNPVGRVFREEELTRMAELCLRYDVLICSDEIHGDLIFNGHHHLPIASLSPEISARTITLMAPSKTFNIAGLDCSFAVVTDPALRKQLDHARKGILGHPNILGYTAGLAAYQEGGGWLEAVLAYLEANRDFVFDYVARELPGLQMAKPEGTFLAWLDCREAAVPTDPYTFFREKGRVMANDGATFGPGGEGFIRLNFGCPRALLIEGLARMKAALLSA